MGDGEGRHCLLLSPDGVAPSQMVGESASVNLPLYHKVHRLTRVVLEKGRKTVVVWCG